MVECIQCSSFLPDSTPTGIDQLLNKLTANILDYVFSGQYFYDTEKVYFEFPKFSFEKLSNFGQVCNKNKAS